MVDIDGNKVVTIEEFVFSIMGDAAMKFGPLAEMDGINVLLNKAVQSFTHLKESLVAAKEDTDNRSLQKCKRPNGRHETKHGL